MVGVDPDETIIDGLVIDVSTYIALTGMNTYHEIPMKPHQLLTKGTNFVVLEELLSGIGSNNEHLKKPSKPLERQMRKVFTSV